MPKDEARSERDRSIGHSALRVRDGKLETFDPYPRIGGEMIISITEDGYICSFGKQSRTAATWEDLIGWLKHHGESALKGDRNVEQSGTVEG